MYKMLFFLVLISFKTYSSTYLKICENPNSAKNSKKTVDVLKGLVDDTTCSGSYKKLMKLKQIIIINQYLKDYTPLESFVNLNELIIANNFFYKINCSAYYHTNKIDFSFIKKLKNLRSLELRSVGLKNTSVLKNMISLRKLELACNEIENIDDLLNLKNLLELNLGQNKLTNINGIENLNKLLTLVIRRNSIEDVSVLSKLDNLLFVDLSYNRLTDIPELLQVDFLQVSNNLLNDNSIAKEFPKLTQFIGDNNFFTKIPKFKNPRRLWTMSLISNDINSTTGLGNYVGLGNLGLAYNPLPKGYESKIEGKVLAYLNIAGTNIKNLPNKLLLPDLQTLNINDNLFTDIQVEDLPQYILTLRASNNRFREINWDENIVSDLYLSNTGLRSFSFNCDPARRLDILDLSNNFIQSNIEINNCDALSIVRLSESYIRDIRFLSKYKILYEIDLSGNPVVDLSPLKDLKHIKKINFRGIPLGKEVPANKLNCPTDAASQVVADWCKEKLKSTISIFKPL